MAMTSCSLALGADKGGALLGLLLAFALGVFKGEAGPGCSASHACFLKRMWASRLSSANSPPWEWTQACNAFPGVDLLAPKLLGEIIVDHFQVELDLQKEAVIVWGCCPSPWRVTTASVAGAGCFASPILSPRFPHVLDRGACYAANASSSLMSSMYLRQAGSDRVATWDCGIPSGDACKRHASDSLSCSCHPQDTQQASCHASSRLSSSSLIVQSKTRISPSSAWREN